MYETSEWAPEGFVPCPPMFVETDNGFALTDAARDLLAVMDPPEPTVAQRLVDVRAALSRLARDLPAAVRALAPHDLLDAVEVLQQASNLTGSCDQAVVAELDRQGVHETAGATSTAGLLAQQLRIRPAEAHRRVATARACTARVGFDGQVLPPLRPHVAAAQASGGITADHALTIDRALSSLAPGLPVETVDAVEQVLVELAGKRDATDVATAGRAARDRLDPEDVEARERAQHRRRSLRLSVNDDGTGRLRGELTAPLLTKLQTVLSPLAAPRPSDAQGDDTRTPDQRMHDALDDVCDRLLRSGTLPDSGGVPATVAVTMTITQLEERAGRVSAAHGGDLTVAQLLHLACEAEIIPVVLNDAGGIMNYGRCRRFATAAQTKALRARDRGCSFPGCRRPPEWCQRHHVEEWVRDHGPTDIDKLTLLCGYHHDRFDGWGWRIEMKDGVPWWVPPAHLDPEQKPLQNTAHTI